MINVHLPGDQNFDEVVAAAVEIVHLKEARFSYPSGAHANNIDRLVHSVQYKPTPNRLKQIANHEVVKE